MATPMQPGMQQQPGMAQPVMAQPQMAQPGMAQPGMVQPVMAQPQQVMAQPMMAQPAMAQPAMGGAVGTLGGAMMGRQPRTGICPHCKANVTTGLRFEPGMGTHATCFGLFCCTGVCCCVPYLLNDMKDATHVCPNCQRIIGVQKFLF